MTAWLYQMNATKWPIERYRAEVWEGTDIQNWGVGEVRSSTSKLLPKPGEIMILFYVKTSQTDPGIYGLGIVLRCDESEMNFRLTTPSDYLKSNPVWDSEVDKIISAIRGTRPANATLFEVEFDSLVDVRRKVEQKVYGKKP